MCSRIGVGFLSKLMFSWSLLNCHPPTHLPTHHPPCTLLQGDVGCGKTIVAFMALLAAAGSGHQGAIMAPTEILAEQHFRKLRELLADMRAALEREGGGGAGKRLMLAHQIDCWAGE